MMRLIDEAQGETEPVMVSDLSNSRETVEKPIRDLAAILGGVDFGGILGFWS
jgi:hypothetical protein